MVVQTTCIFNSENNGAVKSLIINESATKRKWGFATCSHNAPIEQFKFFIHHMRLQGYSADELCVDEDGSLAQSTEFQHTVVKELNMVIQTMGGYYAENN